MITLEYSKWENFIKVINKAKQSCENINISALEYFPDVSKMLEMPNNAEKIIDNYKLTRYACYLIAQNGDSRKKLLLLLKHTLLYKLESKNLVEKNIIN